MPDASAPFGRFTDDFLRRVKMTTAGFPRRVAVREFLVRESRCRAELEEFARGTKRLVACYFSAAENGEAVPTRIIRGILAYIKERRGVTIPFEDAAVLCDPPPGKPFDVDRGSWENVITAVFSGLFGWYEPGFASDHDLREAARRILIRVGRDRYGRNCPDAKALAHGEVLMRCTLDGLTESLARWYAVETKTVVVSPTVVTVGLPLSESAKERLLSGQTEPTDLSADDILPSSPYVLIFAASESQSGGLVRRCRCKMELFLSVLWQTASLLASRNAPEVKPLIMGIQSTKENAQRFRNYEFQVAPSRTPRTNCEIVKLGPDDRPPPDQRHYRLSAYNALMSVLHTCQGVLRERERPNESTVLMPAIT